MLWLAGFPCTITTTTQVPTATIQPRHSWDATVGYIGQSLKLTTHLHRVPGLGVYGAISVLPVPLYFAMLNQTHRHLDQYLNGALF